MSRSRKKTPVFGNAGDNRSSDKEYKKMQHGRERAEERQLVKKAVEGSEDDAQELKHETHPLNDWETDKDGKRWLGNWENKEALEKAMRK